MECQPMDMISDLPDNVIQAILMCLPMRDVVRTSILSRKWRNKWVNIPHLIFDMQMWLQSWDYLKSAEIKFMEIVLQILLQHQGPITKFVLDIPEVVNCSEIDNSIRFISKNGVEEFSLGILNAAKYEEFSLGIFDSAKYVVHSSLFNCLQLRHLLLEYCLIRLPPTFRGFSKLVRLQLTCYVIDVEVLESLISCCPVLEQLLLNLLDPDTFIVDAPKLKLFELRCCPTPVEFKRTHVLESVSLIIHDVPTVDVQTCDFVKFCHSLPALEKLEMDSCFFKIFGASMVQTSLPVTLAYLKILKFNMLHTPDAFLSVLCLIRISPNLEKLHIQGCWYGSVASPSYIQEFLEVQDYSDVSLNELRQVELSKFDGTVLGMELVKVLLDKSPKLKSMVIVPEPYRVHDHGLKILKKLNIFRRASRNVEVHYEDPNVE